MHQFWHCAWNVTQSFGRQEDTKRRIQRTPHQRADGIETESEIAPVRRKEGHNLLFSKAHAHVRLNALSAGLSPGSKKRLEAQAKIGTHSRFVRPCQASALLTWYTSDLWYTSLICAKAKMMDLTGNGNITTAKRARKPLKKP